MKLRRTLALAAATLVALATTALPAQAAATRYATPPAGLSYSCTLPGTSALWFDVTLSFSGPSAAAHGQDVTITGISGTLTLPTYVLSLLHSIGYDAVRGDGLSYLPLTATGATARSRETFSLPELYWTGTSALQLRFDVFSMVFTASGTPGKITFSLTSPFGLSLAFHKASNNFWSPWSMNCTFRLSSPASNTALSPSMANT